VNYICYCSAEKSGSSVLVPDIELYLQGQESYEGWVSADES